MRRLLLYPLFHLCLSLLSGSQNGLYAQPASPHFLLKDTGAILKQLNLSDSISARYPDSAMQLANQALQSSEALKFIKGMETALFQVAMFYQSKNDFLRSVPPLQTALLYCDNTQEGYRKKVRLLYSIGDAYWYSSKSDSAALYYYRALDEINAAKIEAPATLLETYSKLILMWVNLNDTYVPATGTIDKYTESAISYFNKAALQQNQTIAFRSRVLLNQGHIKRMEKNYDSTRYYYRQFLQLVHTNDSMPVNPSGWIVATLLNISESFLEEKKADSTIFYANKVIRKIGIKKKEGQMYYLVAHYFIGKALCLQQKYSEAIRVTLPALQMAKQNNRDYVIYFAHDVLSQAYGATGEYRKAWEAQKAYTASIDSTRKNSNIQAISQMEMRYRVAENKKELAEKELALARKDNSIRNQRTLIAVISGGAALLLLISFLLYRHHSNKQRIKLLQVEQEMEISHLNAMIQGEEKERSRLARELHDGIGGLLGSIRLQLSSALKTYRIEDRSEDFSFILKLLEGAYADLRKTAHNLMPETLQQEGLVKATQLFCRSIHKGGKTEVIFETVGELPALPPHIELSLYRMMQELVHNIIKHGNAGKALVQLAYIDNRLALTVEDDGDGFTPGDETTNQEGMGLTTIRNRVRSLGGTIDVSSTSGEGTSVYIEIIIGKSENTASLS
jgi:signal transduction histidine kinase